MADFCSAPVAGFYTAVGSFNPCFKVKYDQMRIARKTPNVAIVAIMRKLIETANTLVKANRFWTKSGLSMADVLVVQDGQPRRGKTGPLTTNTSESGFTNSQSIATN